MDLRAKMRARCQPFLDEGERIEAVASAQGRVTAFLAPALMLLASIPAFTLRSSGRGIAIGAVVLIVGGGTVLVLFNPRCRVLCWTDRALVVFTSSIWRANPTAVLDRLPRSTRIGPLNGFWAKVQIGGERLVIHPRFHGDVAAAEASPSPPARTRP